MALEHVVHDLPSAATAIFLALFPIVNPLGGVPMFFSFTADYTTQERRRTALKIGIDVIAILIVFMLFGRFVLNCFGISLPVLKIAGGLIVANTAWGMVTGSSRMTTEESSDARTKEDISRQWPCRCRCSRVQVRSEWSGDSPRMPITSFPMWAW
jgi:multiple antibiotic resistance protein